MILEENSPLSRALEDKRLPETLFRTLSAENHGTTHKCVTPFLSCLLIFRFLFWELLLVQFYLHNFLAKFEDNNVFKHEDGKIMEINVWIAAQVVFTFLRSASKAVSATELWVQPAPAPRHCVRFPKHFFFSPAIQNYISPLSDSVCSIMQRRSSWKSVSDGGVRARLASGPLQHAGCGLGLGGRQERGRAWTKDQRPRSTETWRAES